MRACQNVVLRAHERRTVALTPKLVEILQEAFAAAPEGQHTVLPEIGNNEYSRRQLLSAVKPVGVEPGEDLFRTLRSSCEREWAMTFPQFAVSKWIGHSIQVSGKHYPNHVPDEHFDRAPTYAPQAAHNPAHHGSTQGTRESQTEDDEKDVCVPVQAGKAVCGESLCHGTNILDNPSAFPYAVNGAERLAAPGRSGRHTEPARS